MNIDIAKENGYIRITGNSEELRAFGQMLTGAADIPGPSFRISFRLPNKNRDQYPPQPEFIIERVGQ